MNERDQQFDVGMSVMGGAYRAYCFGCRQSLVYWDTPEELEAWKREHAELHAEKEEEG